MYILNFHLGLMTVLINLGCSRGSSLSSKTLSASISQLAVAELNGLNVYFLDLFLCYFYFCAVVTSPKIGAAPI